MGLKMFSTVRNWLGLDPDAGLHEDVMRLTPEDAECMIDGKAISIKCYPLARPVSVEAADVVRCTIHNETVVEAPLKTVVDVPVDEPLRVNTVGVFRTRDVLGFNSALGIVIGERNG